MKSFLDWMFTPTKEERNPYGETFDEFVGKYPDMKHIAMGCWHLGVRPEQFAEEVRKLLETGKNVEEIK